MNIKKDKIIINLKKSQTLIGKIIEMMEENHYCIDIMQQNLAVIGLLRSAHQDLMENHLETCFKAAMASKNKIRQKEMIQEILQATKLFNH